MLQGALVVGQAEQGLDEEGEPLSCPNVAVLRCVCCTVFVPGYSALCGCSNMH